LFCGSKVGRKFSLFALGGKLSLFTPCNFSMLLHHLWRTIKFMIVFLFLVPTSNNLVECNMAQPLACLSLLCKQPKNPKSVINLKKLYNMF
jgi:hypothetical protein